MSKYTEYFLGSKSSVVQLELIEITHSDFTRPYYIVRNSSTGIIVTLEDNTQQAFEYYPLSITPVSSGNDLDQRINISFGDLGEVLPLELQSVYDASGFKEKPVIKYRIYRSDNLTESLIGVWVLEVVKFNFTKHGATFEAKAPSLNVNRTGELYDINRFPMLRGFL